MRAPDRQSPAEPAPRSPAPFVSVLIPVRNEAPYIGANLAAALRQDYPSHCFEVIVADGRSTDGTRPIVESIAASEPRLRLVDNPDRIVAAGLNRALAVARGNVIVRLDGHCEYPADYLRRVVELRAATGAANAGGVLEPIGTTYVQRAICAGRYEARHYPHFNLSRVWLQKNQLGQAIHELEAAVKLCPNYPAALKELSRLRDEESRRTRIAPPAPSATPTKAPSGSASENSSPGNG